MWVIWLKLTPVNSCELCWQKKNTCMVCVCVCSPTIDIYPSSLQSWTLSAAALSFTELVQHVFVTLLFFSHISFPAWVFPPLFLLFWTRPLRQTLADTCLCFYCVWMLCLFWTHTLAYLWHILIYSNHNMTQDRAQEIATCKHLPRASTFSFVLPTYSPVGLFWDVGALCAWILSFLYYINVTPIIGGHAIIFLIMIRRNYDYFLSESMSIFISTEHLLKKQTNKQG